MSSVTQDKSSTSLAPVIALRLVLVALSVACVVTFWKANSLTEDYRLRYAQLVPWLWNLYLTFILTSVFAMISMWNWHKWGVWLLGAMAIATLFTEFYTMGFQLSTLRIPVAGIVVWLAVQPVWKRFV